MENRIEIKDEIYVNGENCRSFQEVSIISG